MTRVLSLVITLALAATVLSGCGGSNIPEPSNLPQATESVYVYYATGRSLVEDRKVVDGANVYKAALDEWLKAQPDIKGDIAIVQPETTAKSVTVKDGMATIDWDPSVLTFDAEDSEKLIALGGILRTFGQFPDVKQVRFTVDGKTSGKIGGKDVEAFWGAVSLKGQPWKVIRPEAGGGETTSTP